MTEPQWLLWSRQLMALAQNGLNYTTNPFDIDRYQTIRKIAAAILAEHTAADQQRIEDLFAHETGYATPKIDVRGVVFRDDALLLVKEREDGRWTLPGGWADVNESPSEAVVREVFEESGYRTRATKLLAVLDRAKHPHLPLFPFHIYKHFLRCEWLGGEPTTSSETEAVGFFREDQLPELSTSRTTPAQIARMFEHFRQPDLPADFD
jgi:ADP-ribose pyrophosphatase YjhB (NUDIX family)